MLIHKPFVHIYIYIYILIICNSPPKDGQLRDMKSIILSVEETLNDLLNNVVEQIDGGIDLGSPENGEYAD